MYLEYVNLGLYTCTHSFMVEKIITADMVDNVIRAKIPDPIAELELFLIITNHMVYWTMRTTEFIITIYGNNKCSKRYCRLQ